MIESLTPLIAACFYFLAILILMISVFPVAKRGASGYAQIIVLAMVMIINLIQRAGSILHLNEVEWNIPHSITVAVNWSYMPLIESILLLALCVKLKYYYHSVEDKMILKMGGNL